MTVKKLRKLLKKYPDQDSEIQICIYHSKKDRRTYHEIRSLGISGGHWCEDDEPQGIAIILGIGK